MMACQASPSTVVGIAVHLVATTQRRMCLYLFSFANLLQQHTHHFLLSKEERKDRPRRALPGTSHSSRKRQTAKTAQTATRTATTIGNNHKTTNNSHSYGCIVNDLVNAKFTTIIHHWCLCWSCRL